jgi:superoxide dismutase
MYIYIYGYTNIHIYIGIAPVIFNNAAQSWNHEFYWNCMKKGGGGKPMGKVAEAIDTNFGSYDEFKKQVRFLDVFSL